MKVVVNPACEHSQASTPVSQKQRTVFFRNTAMLTCSILFTLCSAILFIIGLFPQTTIPFAGAFFVIGMFLSFSVLSIFLVALVYNMKNWLLNKPIPLPFFSNINFLISQEK
ncbi:hypothetical protein FTN15_03875 [Chlamydia trachomatis]|jgi:hypothetical protein|uniref:Membrane protein n=2 Tax=Chlamydia muridarum TaxID=83560 RepID=A0A070A0N6_CHLMR|nr:hypothetical protein [Chlamydia muridarum]UFT35874.1 hypothetical protein FTN57_03875 [Chlamydia trachomatis]AAF39534.1 conserved hypothetical protein [Chlamydia muridarum str. Nigg]AHH23109.1 membrane protein [Chlamydia muridarum str. Nigg3 CMUT3-5]AHH24034.1 membrane protein [Chlamydia muridarum str. Nigg CM972]AID38239.1 membrane protein [Chlamydia muridarum str. Nigg 2 MCR]